ncbi:3'(2'),5'-bisphosphate nucleotidase CysQ [Ruegeria sp. 2205SS24-7]|uniref:inositol monophosphatase family protein n=1 Tax=Ruegeria discodermiae TaxID=3064389 RepID=UPI00274136D2|nr:3'(2'),5'-bisphosphate nucleotidase CysQ [Ruegeria sp. 2205SS24-7]MDP5218275.1 3'(2'),5'-bisphosphate nucleotidase CysQ [Ruegeria sp. 2205SS24-7]
MPGTDLPLLMDAAREAGQIATRFFRRGHQSWDKPGGAGPVTEADLAVNKMLEETLPAARPDYGWLSEESEDSSDRLNKSHVFILDPIDGTRSFTEGSRTWAHSFAVARDGIITAAVIYLPLRDLMYCAAAGHGATLNGEQISASQTQMLDLAEILSARPNMDGRHWKEGQPPGFRRSYRPSLAYRLALVAQGRFDGMLTLRRSWEWDIAAGDLILREAGGGCTDRNGAPLRFNNPSAQVDGVVAGGIAVQQQLTGALKPVT